MLFRSELLGSRGSDARLEEDARATRKERKAAYHEKMDAKAATRAEFEQERLAERANREGSRRAPATESVEEAGEE